MLCGQGIWEYVDSNVGQRIVARGGMDICTLGRVARAVVVIGAVDELAEEIGTVPIRPTSKRGYGFPIGSNRLGILPGRDIRAGISYFADDVQFHDGAR